MNFAFASPEFFLLLFPLFGAFIWTRKKGEIREKMTFSNVNVLPPEGLTITRNLLRLLDGVRWIALTLLVVALARPQIPDREVLSGEGVDVMIALDMSASMNAVDLDESQLQERVASDERVLNRFENARELLSQFVSNRHEDRIGLVIFGEKAYLKFPPTLDYTRILRLLDGLILDNGERQPRSQMCTNQCTIQGHGTAIGDALARSYSRLKPSESTGKVIILITDGTNEGGQLQPEDVLRNSILKTGDEDPIRIYTFLVGNDQTSYIPVTDRFGRTQYQKSARPFPTNPELLKTLAGETGGLFFESYNEESFREHFEELERSEFTTTVTTQYREVFASLVWLALALLLLEALIRKGIWREYP